MNAHSEFSDPGTPGVPNRAPRWLVALEGIVGRLTEGVAALLVVAEIVILFAGVVSRYLFHEPIIWSDELASILFLWLAMLGAVVALPKTDGLFSQPVPNKTP